MSAPRTSLRSWQILSEYASCRFEWGSGKTFRIVQDYRRPDGTLVAELTGVAGVMDLAARKLAPDPAERLRALATNPEMFA